MRRVLLIAVPAALLVTLIWYFFALRPINNRIADARDELQIAQDQELQLRTQLNRLKRVQENELAYLSALGAVEAAIPPTPQMPVLIDDLKELADQTGVVWLSGTFGNPTEPDVGDFKEIPLTLQVEGQFFEILGYLYGIADLDRLVRIESLSISPQEEEGFTVLAVSISGTAFTTGDIEVPIFPELEEELEDAIGEAINEAIDAALEEAGVGGDGGETGGDTTTTTTPDTSTTTTTTGGGG